jgi:hypothetical protein
MLIQRFFVKILQTKIIKPIEKKLLLDSKTQSIENYSVVSNPLIMHLENNEPSSNKTINGCL